MEKALVITPFYKPNIGGAETFAEDLAKALSKKYVVHICTIKWNKPTLWQGLPFTKAVTMLYKLFIAYRRMVRKYKYERVYALGLISAFLCAMLKVKFYAVMLALYDVKRNDILIKSVLNKASKVFVEGEGGKLEMVMAGVRENKLVIFNHWVDQNRFRYIPKQNKTMRVLFIGRPIKIKGKHIIKECEKLTKDIEYEYVENVRYEDLPKHYQMADICVVPSLYSEGFSRVVVEAASCGCAVITSDNGSLPELVDGWGKCIDPTPQNFAKELTKLKFNRVGLTNLQMNTALYALQHFGVKNADVFLL